MAVILVEQATEDSWCTACGSMHFVYKIVIGNVSFYLCERCAVPLYRALEVEVGPLDPWGMSLDV